VTLTVTIPLSQPWADNESAGVIRNRAKRQATEQLQRALQNDKVKGVIKDQAVVMIYSTTEE